MALRYDGQQGVASRIFAGSDFAPGVQRKAIGAWAQVADMSPGPEQQTIDLYEIRRLIADIPDELNRQIVYMIALGYTCAAIGEVLGKEHAISERLRRLRQRNSRQNGGR